MICTYLRSSGMGTWDGCKHQYCLEYGLGIKKPVLFNNTVIGIIVHKVLEMLANRKMAEQNGENNKYFDDEAVGKIHINDCTPIILTDKAFAYYSTMYSNLCWSKKDLTQCLKHVQTVLNYEDGMFSPLKRTILKAEQHFDIPINKEWATYKDNLGEQVNLRIKGTIDLIATVDNSIIEIIDWKTGAHRTDFNTGAEKNYTYLSKDKQLMLYYYAAKQLYPDKDIIVTIYYVQAGGPFTVSFDQKHIILLEDILRKYFVDITNYNKPQLTKTWKCSKICGYGDKGGYNENGETKCVEIQKYMIKNGLDATIKQYAPHFNPSVYQDGGGQSSEARQNKEI